MKNFKFTIFTSCYNGEKTIHRVFESVNSQIYKNFEWIIVNDGSQDNSDTVIRNFINLSPIKDKIIYICQENIGKHRTWNKILEIADSDFLLSADCDDSFLPNTLDFFNKKANCVLNGLVKLNNNKTLLFKDLMGFNVRVFNPDDNSIISSPVSYDGLVGDSIYVRMKFHLQGERWGCNRTDLLKKYKFPDMNGHFYPESRVWWDIAMDGYKLVFYNDVLRAYFQEDNSLTHRQSDCFSMQRNLMWLDFHIWQIRRGVVFKVLKLNIREGIRMFLCPFYDFIKIFLSCFKYII